MLKVTHQKLLFNVTHQKMLLKVTHQKMFNMIWMTPKIEACIEEILASMVAQPSQDQQSQVYNPTPTTEQVKKPPEKKKHVKKKQS